VHYGHPLERLLYRVMPLQQRLEGLPVLTGNRLLGAHVACQIQGRVTLAWQENPQTAQENVRCVGRFCRSV